MRRTSGHDRCCVRLPEPGFIPDMQCNQPLVRGIGKDVIFTAPNPMRSSTSICAAAGRLCSLKIYWVF